MTQYRRAILALYPSTDPFDNPKLNSYDVRVSPDDPYKAASETSIGHIAKIATTFEFANGLTTTGATVRARVYVVLTTGNEKGSATVKITRI